MKNNYGFGKFEVLTVIVLLLVVGAILAYKFLGGASAQKLDTMKESAVSFSRAASVNNDTFHNTENIYLGEVIDEELMKEIKNPVGSGYCSKSGSVVRFENGIPYVTLQCGEYLIEHVNISSKKDIPIYQVTDWSETKATDEDEERVLYNCTENNKEVFEDYYDDLYFVYQYNKKYGTNYYFPNTITGNCKVLSKTFYRTKTLVQ